MEKKELFKKVEARLFAYKDLQIQINELNLRLEEETEDYRGCGAICYDEKSSPTFSITSSVENEIVSREKRINRIKKLIDTKIIEKKRIENALTCLDIIETEFVNKYYNHRGKISMNYIAMSMHMDRSSCYRMREEVVYKLMGMLYHELNYEGLPMFS